jgi:hypothetical protein
MFDLNHYREELPGVSKMVLAVFNTEALKEKFLSHSVCQFAFASSNTILLQTAHIFALHRFGFTFLALKFTDPQFLDHSKVHLWLRAFPLSQSLRHALTTAPARNSRWQQKGLLQ